MEEPPVTPATSRSKATSPTPTRAGAPPSAVLVDQYVFSYLPPCSAYWFRLSDEGSGKQSGAQGDGGNGSQSAASAGGDGGAGNEGGDNLGGDNQNSNDFGLALDLPIPFKVRRYAPGAYDVRRA